MSLLAIWNVLALGSILLLLFQKTYLRAWTTPDSRSIFILVVVMAGIPAIGIMNRLELWNESQRETTLLVFYAAMTVAVGYRIRQHYDQWLLKARAKSMDRLHPHSHSPDPQMAAQLWVGMMRLLSEIEISDPCTNPECERFRARLREETERLRAALDDHLE